MIHGSYTSEKRDPIDLDVVLLPDATSPLEFLATSGFVRQWPFLDVQIAADEQDFRWWAEEFFGRDRHGQPKGVVEGDPMTHRLDVISYEYTKSKFQEMEGRVAALQAREDLHPIQKQQGIWSYRDVMR